MKSKIAGIIILILVLMSILPSFVNADEEEQEIDTSTGETFFNNNDPVNYSQDSFERMRDEGKAITSIGGNMLTKDVKPTKSVINGFSQTLGTVLFIPAILARSFMSLVANGNLKETITIEEFVFNECDIINANYIENTSNEFNTSVKDSVKKWFYAIRNLAIAISILVLIYAGIRLAISSTATDKATYKSMIKDWIVGMIIIFMIQYLVVLGMAISDKVVEIFRNLKVESFEKNIGWDVMVSSSKGWAYVVVVIMYLVITYYEVKFFMIYTRRFFTIGFLIVISPLITLTYAIDKAKDNKSQIVDSWVREFLGNMFVQPLHAGIYLIFIASANEIFKVAPILSVVLFIAMGRGEKLFKNIFGLKKMTSIKNVDDK